MQEISSRPLSSEAQKERRLAKYNGQIVLLDPKNYGENPEGTDGDKIYARVKDLAQELSKMMPEECQTLHCKGWYEDSKRKQFYLVYEPPPYSSAPTEYKTLYDYIGSTFRPSLNDRISLARQLAKSIHQIHEKGWLHKGIRSDHVLFFPEKRGAPRSINNPRLVGFDFARRDAADEVSEKNVKMLVFHVIHLPMLCRSLNMLRIDLHTPTFTATLKPLASLALRSRSYMTIIALGFCLLRSLCGRT